MKKALILFILLIFPCSLFAGTRVINYGFEDWTGSWDTTPGSPYSGSGYWDDFTGSNTVSSSSCGSRAAYEGTYYQHRAFDTDTTDACLGQAPASINDHGNIGAGLTYPSGYGDKTELSTVVTSDTLVFRARIRFVGNWKTATWTGTPQCKFFRLYGVGGTTDPASAEVVMRWDGTPTNPRFTIYDPGYPDTYDGGSAYGASGSCNVDLFDGNWHTVGVKTVRNNDTNASGNITQSVYIDDWDLTGTPVRTRTINCTAFGAGFDYLCMMQNFSAVYPNEQLSMDTDNIEIWDGLPDDDAPAPPTISNATISNGRVQ